MLNSLDHAHIVKLREVAHLANHRCTTPTTSSTSEWSTWPVGRFTISFTTPIRRVLVPGSSRPQAPGLPGQSDHQRDIGSSRLHPRSRHRPSRSQARYCSFSIAANIMFAKPNDTGSLKIVDFGLSARYSRGEAQSLTEKCGTMIYTAPEVFANYEYSKALPGCRTISTWTSGAWASLCTLC